MLSRTPSKSEKLKAAARRNGKLGGRKPIAPLDVLTKLHRTRKEWTWQDFVAAVEAKTGVVYSRTQAFTLLKQLKTPAANAVMFNDGGLDAAVTQEQPASVAKGKRILR